MQISRKARRSLIVGGAVLAISATPSFALFGFGDIVFDPSSYAELIAQVKNSVSQLETIKANVTHFSFKEMWQTALTQLEQTNVKNLFGESNGMQQAITRDDAAAASMAWTSGTQAVNSTTTTYLQGQRPGSSQLSQLALINLSDSAGPDCLNAVGQYRAARTTNAAAVANLAAEQVDDNDGSNSEVQQLNLINAGEAQKMTEMQTQGTLQTCVASQMTIASMQQRNAAAQDLNTAAYVMQEHQNNPNYNTGGSSSWTSYLP